MVSKLCCLGSLFKHQGKYYPRITEAAPDLIEQTTWQDFQHDEAEYPYEWLKSAATQKHCSSRGRKRRFLSRIRTIHAVDDSGIAEDFTLNSTAANEDLSGKGNGVTGSVSEPAVGSKVTEAKNVVALETVKSRTMGIDNVVVENTKEQDTNITSALKDAAVDAKELSPPTSLPEQVKGQTGKGKQNKSVKDTPSSSEKHEVEVTQDKNISEKLLENERRCADTASSPPSMSSPCSASASAKSPVSNTQKDTPGDQDESTAVSQTHQQSEQDNEGGEQEEEQPPIAERDNVRDQSRLDMERQEQRMQDWIRRNRFTAPSGPRSLQLIDRTSERLNHPSQQRPNEDQSETDQSLILHNEQVADHLSTHHRPQPHLPLQLPHHHRQRNQSERRGSQHEHRSRQLNDVDQLVRHMHLQFREGRFREDGAEQGDRWHEREEERRERYLLHQQHHLRTLGLAGEVGPVRNNAERNRENIVRELRQQAHRRDNRMVGAIVRQRHSQQEQNDGPPGPQPNNPPPPFPPPPELERRVRPSEIGNVQRLNPHPPQRRRRCQKRSVFQPKKE